MAASTYKPTRLFTVEQANAMLPLVRAITRDIVELANEVMERKQRLELLVKDRPSRTADVYRDELSLTEEEIDKDVARLQGYVEELMELGVELKGPLEGLVDFPTQIDGKPALLCWKLGEPAVGFWHDLDSGFAGRQPLTDRTCCEPGESDEAGESGGEFGDSPV
ncbi:MAG: DUF2203 domain-containing protein [Pirellulales bacterium]|jgi:hypothetical protein